MLQIAVSDETAAVERQSPRCHQISGTRVSRQLDSRSPISGWRVIRALSTDA